MNLRQTSCLAAAVIIIPSASLFAGPLQRADLPAEPTYALHLDCDALRGSSLGKFLIEQMNTPAAENKIAAFQAMFNFDPRTALHGISVYGSGKKPEDGLLVVYADLDGARLEMLVRGAKEYQSSTHRSRTIHSWIDENRKFKGEPVPRRMYAAVAGNRVLFGQRQDRVAAGLDVFDGFAANLAGSKALPSLGGQANGMFLQAASSKLDLGEGNPNAALVRLSQEMRLEVGEANGAVTANMSLLAKDEEVAGHMNSIAQGLLALMKMQTDKPQQVKLAESLVLKQENSALTGTLSIPSADFVGLLKAGAKKAGMKD